MKSYALGLAVNGSENDKISCFHEDKKTSDGKKRLENEVVIYLQTKYRSFTHIKEDTIAAAPSFMIIDESDDEDANIED